MPIFSALTQPIEAQQKALQIIQNGEILLFPTETVYGLGVDSAQPAAIERLYRIKGRPREKPFQWLISDSSFARANSRGWDTRAEKLARKFWPGPLTLVIPTLSGSIGWRVPHHPWLQCLLEKLGHPLVATSANRSGRSITRTFKTALQEFEDVIGLAINGGNLELPTAMEVSTVVSLETTLPKILREGAIPKTEIFQVLTKT